MTAGRPSPALLACLALSAGLTLADSQPPMPAGQGVELAYPAEPGDIVCRLGTGIWSNVFRRFNTRDERFSHVGIVVLRQGTAGVLHADANDLTGVGSVTWTPIPAFIGESSRWAAFRLHESREQREAIAQAAALLEGRPFDTDFSLSDQKAVYCTELVWFAINTTSRLIRIEPATLQGKAFVATDRCFSPAIADEVASGAGIE